MRTRAAVGAALIALAGACASGAAGHVTGPDPDAERSSSETDVLWPFYQRVEADGVRRTTVYPLYYDRLLTDEHGRRDHDWALFPFLVGGSDAEEGDHFLFFPFWGNLKELLGKDEIRVRLFPLYVDAVEGEYRSAHVLWPLVSWGSGGGRRDFRFLPFYARKVKDGYSRSTSVLWPFVTWGEEDLETEHPTTSLFLFPFYGRTDSDVAWSRTYLWPFFTFAGNEAGWSETNVLWPVYRRMESPRGRSAIRVWPLFSQDRRGANRDDWYAWPIVWDRRLATPEGAVRSTYIAPILRKTGYLDLEGGSRGGVIQVWPLFRGVEREDGSRRFDVLAPIPFSDWDAFEAMFSPLWTVLTVEREEDGGSVSLLSGLLGFEHGAEGRALRLLWFIRVEY